MSAAVTVRLAASATIEENRDGHGTCCFFGNLKAHLELTTKKIAFAAAALLATTSAPAVAAPLIYTITGTFSGSTAGGAFANVRATFTGRGDTSTATTGGFEIPSYVAVNLSSFTAFTPGRQSYLYDHVAGNIRRP